MHYEKLGLLVGEWSLILRHERKKMKMRFMKVLMAVLVATTLFTACAHAVDLRVWLKEYDADGLHINNGTPGIADTKGQYTYPYDANWSGPGTKYSAMHNTIVFKNSRTGRQIISNTNKLNQTVSTQYSVSSSYNVDSTELVRHYNILTTIGNDGKRFLRSGYYIGVAPTGLNFKALAGKAVLCPSYYTNLAEYDLRYLLPVISTGGADKYSLYITDGEKIVYTEKYSERFYGPNPESYTVNLQRIIEANAAPAAIEGQNASLAAPTDLSPVDSAPKSSKSSIEEKRAERKADRESRKRK